MEFVESSIKALHSIISKGGSENTWKVQCNDPGSMVWDIANLAY